MSTTQISRRINAPRSVVYRALLDARAVAAWRVPDGMSSEGVDADGGTEIAVACEGLPPGLPEAVNDTGTRMALAKLARLVDFDPTTMPN